DLLILCLCAKPAAGVVALNKRTGREVWKALDDSFTYSSPITFAAGGKRQCIAWTQEAVTSLDPATGKIGWREPVATSGDMAISTPVYDNDRLLVGGLMFAIDPGTGLGTVLWPKEGGVSKRILSNTSTAWIH